MNARDELQGTLSKSEIAFAERRVPVVSASARDDFIAELIENEHPSELLDALLFNDAAFESFRDNVRFAYLQNRSNDSLVSLGRAVLTCLDRNYERLANTHADLLRREYRQAQIDGDVDAKIDALKERVAA